MTVPNDFADFLAALEQQPGLREAVRNHILGEEFLQLPAIARRQEELIGIISERQMELADTVRDLAQQISQYALASSRVITATVERQDRIQTDIDDLKAAQSRLEASVELLRESQARMETAASELKTGQTRMQGQLNNLMGTDCERKVARRAPRVARRYLDLRQVNVVYGITAADSVSVNIQELLDQAAESGTISHAESDELERTDLIMTGLTPAGESVYAVAEVSLTIDDHDVDRARNRSRILQRASDTASRAIVIGTAISDANRQRAVQGGVAIVIMEE